MDIALVVTHDCNLGCSYCSSGEKFRKRMSVDVMRRALDLGFSDGGDAPLQLAFFGGEPLLEWELLALATLEAEARAQASRRRLQPTVTTNGTLLDEDKLRFLMEHGFFIGLSIDGLRQAHEATRPTRGGRSSFDSVARALALLVKAGAWFETMSVIDPANVRWLGPSVRWLAAEGAPRIALSPNYGADWSDEDQEMWERGYREAAALYVERALAGRPLYLNCVEDRLVTRIKGGYQAEDRCKIGHGAVAVSPSGNLYPCERMVEEDRDGALRIGDVFAGLDAGRRLVLTAQCGPVNDECGGCAVKERCGSFCACANRAETGEVGVAGGVQCWHEQMAMRVADEAGAEIWRARNPRLVARVFGGARNLLRGAALVGGMMVGGNAVADASLPPPVHPDGKGGHSRHDPKGEVAPPVPPLPGGMRAPQLPPALPKGTK